MAVHPRAASSLHRIGIERLVGDDGDGFSLTEHLRGQDAVIALAWGQDDPDDLLRLGADRGANLGRQPAAGAADVFGRTAARSGGGTMSLADGAIEQQLFARLRHDGALEQPLPDPSLAPAAEPLPHRVAVAEFNRQVSPGKTAPQQVVDPAQKAAVTPFVAAPGFAVTGHTPLDVWGGSVGYG